MSFNPIESHSSPEVNENDLNSLEVHAEPFSQAIDNTCYKVVSLVGGSVFPSAMPKMATQTHINVRDARNIIPLPISYINYCMDYRDCTQNPISPGLSSEALLNAPYTHTQR